MFYLFESLDVLSDKKLKTANLIKEDNDPWNSNDQKLSNNFGVIHDK